MKCSSCYHLSFQFKLFKLKPHVQRERERERERERDREREREFPSNADILHKPVVNSQIKQKNRGRSIFFAEINYMDKKLTTVPVSWCFVISKGAHDWFLYCEWEFLKTT